MDAQWLNERRKGIGGSDVAAILGLSPWKTAFEVWEEKLHRREGSEQTPAMSYGLLVEPVIRQWYSNETGRTVHLPDKILQLSTYPFMLASLDGITGDGRLLEIKTARSSKDWGEPGIDEIPIYYQTQVQHYLFVSGLEVADVVVSFAGTMPVIYTVEADPEIHALLVEKESEFWAMVENQTPPEPVTFSDMVARFKSSTASIVTADLVTEGLVERLRIVRTAMKELEKEEEEVKAQLMKAMGEHDTLADVEGKVLVTWKQGGPTKRFDTKDFQSAQSELYTEYLKEGDPIRRFLLK